MKFNIGDRVVHPHHGVGYVAGLEERQFEPGVARKYYKISIPDTTLWTPVDLSDSGLRRLSMKNELDQCRRILQSAPLAIKADRGLQTSLVDHIKQGTIMAQCEVVRDLGAYGWHRPLFGSIADFQRMIFNVLCQEWAAIEDLSVEDASHEIGALLKKGRAVHEGSTQKKN